MLTANSTTINEITKPLLIIVIVSLIVILLSQVVNLDFFANCNDYIPFSDYDRFSIKENTIFISIASYRDFVCSETVRSIYENADNPQNVFLGICEQNSDDIQEDCVPSLLETTEPKNIEVIKKYADNIKVKRLTYKQAKGPTFARYWSSKLWSGQQYYLQIDSHTQFVKGWDSLLIRMYKEAVELSLSGSGKVVLSTYPPTEEQLKASGFPVIDSTKKDSNGLYMFNAILKNFDDKTKPEENIVMKSPIAACSGGFFFTEAKFLYDVPYDPNLSNLFQGEELLFTARLWTSGYDFYVPKINVLSHLYNRKANDKNVHLYYEDNTDTHYECRKQAENKVKFLLKLDNSNGIMDDFLRDINKYGLGNVRSLDDFWVALKVKI